MQMISMIDANDFIVQAVLDDVQYRLHFAWNDAVRQWTVDIRDTSNADLVRGIAVMPNFPLLLQHQRHKLPKGELLAVVNDSQDKASQSIPRDGFLTGKFTMVYIPEDEINEFI